MPPRQAGNVRSPVYGEPAMKSIPPSFRACDGLAGVKTNSMSTPSSRKNPSCTAAMATKYEGEIASATVSRIFPRSRTHADDLVPVGRVLVRVGDPHEERIVEEAPHELHADRKTRRRLAHGERERRVA